MSSEKIASAVNILKGNLAAGWDIISGSQGESERLGIARRFGGSAAAYSLRDIGAVNGRVVRVRRSSDDAEEDFSANQVASGALEAFVGSGNNGFVSIWYDQSTSGNNAVQTTAGNQPSIVQSGGICKSNGSPSVLFTGDTRDDELDFTDLTLTDAAIFTVVNIDSSADLQILLGGSASTTTGTMMPMMDNASSSTEVYKNSTVGSQFKNGSAITLSNRDGAFDGLAVDEQILFTMIDVDVAEAKVLDGISRCPTNATTFHLQGKMNELIIYNSDQAVKRTAIEANINSHYSIF